MQVGARSVASNLGGVSIQPRVGVPRVLPNPIGSVRGGGGKKHSASLCAEWNFPDASYPIGKQISTGVDLVSLLFRD